MQLETIPRADVRPNDIPAWCWDMKVFCFFDDDGPVLYVLHQEDERKPVLVDEHVEFQDTGR